MKMARFRSFWVLFLAAIFVAAGCGGADPQESESAASPESEQTQSTDEGATEGSARKEPRQQGTPAEQNGEASAREDAKSSGLIVTTIEGEKARIGEQGTVTALFFMAGW